MKALVVGGSSGIGLSIVLNLLEKGDCVGVYVVDKAPFPDAYANDRVMYIPCDLSKGDYSCLECAEDIRALYITAGFGHLKYFQELSEDYIQNSFSVNSVAPIQIIRHYYDRMLSKENFHCAVMVSIAGRLSSPLFSVYSATKAALSKFIARLGEKVLPFYALMKKSEKLTEKGKIRNRKTTVSNYRKKKQRNK